MSLRLEVKTHVFDIPQRLQEIDPTLRVLFNTAKQVFEIWGRDIRGPYLITGCGELDQRVLLAVRQGYFCARSTGRPYEKLLSKQEMVDYAAKQAQRKRLQDIEYGIKDDLKYLGKPVVSGATF